MSQNEDGGRKERSPSYPFISLPKALERARAFSDAHKRSPTRLASAAETWGYAPTSSGLLQTASALKAFGLLEDLGKGAERKVQLTDLAQRILHDARPGAKEAAIKEAALRPRLFAEYADKWLPERPSDSHCLSELRLDRGFTEVASRMFLRSFDETVTYANLKIGDNSSLSSQDTENDVRPEFLPSKPAPLPVGEQDAFREVTTPWRVTFTGKSIDISARLSNVEDAEHLIKSIEALKLLLRSPDEMKEAAG